MDGLIHDNMLAAGLEYKERRTTWKDQQQITELVFVRDGVTATVVVQMFAPVHAEIA